jgi:hypothetical protein
LTTTAAPWAARALATAAPMPELEPVTRANCPAKRGEEEVGIGVMKKKRKLSARARQPAAAAQHWPKDGHSGAGVLEAGAE